MRLFIFQEHFPLPVPAFMYPALWKHFSENSNIYAISARVSINHPFPREFKFFSLFVCLSDLRSCSVYLSNSLSHPKLSLYIPFLQSISFQHSYQEDGVLFTPFCTYFPWLHMCPMLKNKRNQKQQQCSHPNPQNHSNSGFRFKTVEWKDMCSSPPVRAPNLQLAVEQPSTRGHWNPPKKKKKKKPTSKTKDKTATRP